MNMYTIEFFEEEDDVIEDLIQIFTEVYPEIQFTIYKENISEQLQ